MYPLGAEGTPLKVHFASTGGAVIGAIFADGLECSGEGIGFFLGTRQVALLGRDQLCLNGRSVGRDSLDRRRPFWFESVGRFRVQRGGNGTKTKQNGGRETTVSS
jgi:hypothetical protein